MAGTNWRTAKSLLKLKTQLVDEYGTFPSGTFGFIGDTAHQRVASDHNPNDDGVVTAVDISRNSLMDIHDLAENIRDNPHPNAKYIISNARIAGPFTGWNWGYYDGIDPHDTHIHISVGRGPDGKSTQPYDDETNWNIGEDTMTITKENEVAEIFRLWSGREPTKDEIQALMGKYLEDVTKYLRLSGAGEWVAYRRELGQKVIDEKWLQNIQDLRADVQKLKDAGAIDVDKLNQLAKQADEVEQGIKALKGDKV